MPTSKFTWLPITILLGMLVLTSILFVPVQAKSAASDVQQSGDPAGKPPTKTRRPKSTSIPKTSVPKATPVPKTATPKSTNTVANPTNATITPSLDAAVSTGSPVVTVSPQATFTFSSDMNTVVAQLTATSGAVYRTSTSAALTASSTPTNIGAPTSTPNDLEQTATSIVLTTVPTSAYGQPTVTLLAENVSAANPEPPVTAGQSAAPQTFPKIFLIIGVGFLVLVILLYLLGRELKRSIAKNK